MEEELEEEKEEEEWTVEAVKKGGIDAGVLGAGLGGRGVVKGRSSVGGPGFDEDEGVSVSCSGLRS